MIAHIWWHLALYYLSQGRDQKVLELYDRRCWGIAKDYSQDQVGCPVVAARKARNRGRRRRAALAGSRPPSRCARARYGAAVSDAPALITVSAQRGVPKRTRCSTRCGDTPIPRPVSRGMAGDRAARLRGLYAYAHGDYIATQRHWRPDYYRTWRGRRRSCWLGISSNKSWWTPAVKSGRAAPLNKCWSSGAWRIRTVFRSTWRFVRKLGLRELGAGRAAAALTRPASGLRDGCERHGASSSLRPRRIAEMHGTGYGAAQTIRRRRADAADVRGARLVAAELQRAARQSEDRIAVERCMCRAHRARPIPSCAIIATRLHSAVVRSALHATTPSVVLAPDCSRPISRSRDSSGAGSLKSMSSWAPHHRIILVSSNAAGARSCRRGISADRRGSTRPVHRR